MEKQKKFIAFDWNGTLIDDVKPAHKSFAAVQAAYGYPECLLEEYQSYFQIPIENLFLNAGFPANDVLAELPKMLGIFHEVYAPLERETPLREGAGDMLESLAKTGVQSVIFSNHLKYPIIECCEKFGLSRYLDDVLSNEDIAEQARSLLKKERLLRYMAAQGITEKNTIIVGDTPEEIEIAREIGAVGVAITGGYSAQKRLEACDPEFLIHSLDELPAIAHKIFERAA